jgi:hypothetical protein
MTPREITGIIIISLGFLMMCGIIRVPRRPILRLPPGFAIMLLGGTIAGWVQSP